MRRFALFLLAFLFFIHSAPAANSPRKTITDLNLTAIPLNEAIDTIQEASRANIHVNWRALEAAGVAKDAPVNIHVKDVTLEKALTLILSDAGGTTKLAFTSDGGVIEITTQDLADEKLYRRVYVVADLLWVFPNVNVPVVDITQQSSSGGSSGGGGSGSGLFGNSSGASTNTQANQAADEKIRATDLMTLIKTNIRPAIWSDNGGPATMSYYNGNLVVTAPKSVLDAIGRR